MRSRHQLWNMYITAAVSVALVLCLVGMLSTLLLSAGNLMAKWKEDITITVILEEGNDSIAQQRFENMLRSADYCRSYRYVSKEEALAEHIATLGEDPTAFLGYNPLSASYEIHPTADHATPERVKALEQQFTQLPYVSRVLYAQDLLSVMNRNISHLALALLGIGAVLLLIACVLIVNTIRLQIYSKRFLINTMTLVGATSWTIKAPFVARYLLLGFISSLFAIAIVGGAIYYAQIYMGIVLFPLTLLNIGIIVASILLSGLLITFFSALIATGRYIRMDFNTLHEI